MLAAPLWYKTRYHPEDYSELYDAGFEYVEISLDYPWPFKMRDKLDEQVSIIRRTGMKTGVHMPWRDISLLSPYASVREGGIKVLEELLEPITSIEAEYAVLHVTTRENMKTKDLDETIEWVSVRLKEVVDRYREEGVTVVIENLASGPSSLKSIVLKLARGISSKICFDLAHLVARELSRGVNTREGVREKLVEWASSIGDLTALMHLHSVIASEGRVLEHLPLTREDMETYADILRMILGKQEHVVIGLEVFYKDAARRKASVKHLVNSARLVLEALR